MTINTVTVAFRGHDVQVEVSGSTTCGQVAEFAQHHAIQPLALHTLRLLVPKHGAVQLMQQPNRLLTDTGVQPGSRCILLGSTQSELQALEDSRQAEAALRLPGFDYEAQRAAARSTASPGGTPGKHYFGDFKVLPANPFAPPGAPPPSAALGVLHKLAADPAIAAVMQQHGWSVPLLSEMPPEGRVGVSAVCILGYNVNKGEEISLRLRTDDYAGFRKYLAIRQTLVHELTHNVWDDHDINFKKLNSQLLKEVEEFEATHAAACTVAGMDAAYDPTAAQQQQQPVKGRTLAEAVAAEGQQQLLINHRVLPAAELARAAALARQQQQQQQQMTPSASNHSAAGAAGPAAVEQAAADTALAGATAGIDADMTPAAAPAASEEDLQQYEHDDPMTAAAEAAAEQLGSLQTDEPADVDMLPAQQELSTKLQAQLLPPPMQQQQQQQQLGQQRQEQLCPDPAPAADAASQGQLVAQAAAARDVVYSQGIELAANLHNADQQDVTAAATALGEGCTCCGQASEQVHIAPVEAPAGVQSVTQDVSQQAVQQTSSNSSSSRPTAADQQYHRHCHPAAEVALAAATEGPAAANESAAAAAADVPSAEEALLFEGLDDVLKEKLQQAGQLVQQLVQQSRDSTAAIQDGVASTAGEQQQQQQAVAVLEALQDVLRNLAEHPNEPRYRRLRCNNAAFHRRLGRFPAARQLLVLAGFAEQQQQQQWDGQPSAPGLSDPVLVYVRDDPGLVWLVLSVVRQALEKVSC